MKEYDQVKLVVDRETYIKKGVYKGMLGTVIWPSPVNGKWLVNFDGEFLQSPDGVWYAPTLNAK